MNTSSESRNPRELEDEVEARRSDIEETVSALINRLSPDRLMDQMMDYARGGGGDVSRSLVEAVRANPLPTLLTATGLTWLLFGQTQRESRPRLAEDELPSRASYGVDPDYDIHAGEGHRALGEAGPPESAAHMAQRYREPPRRNIEQLLDEQPLAAGIMGLALGALIGASLPRSRQEDERLGDYGLRMREQASRLGEKASVKIDEVGRHVAEGPREPDPSNTRH